MDQIVLTTFDGQRVELPGRQGRTLAQAIFLAGLWPDTPLCAGLGKCGLCRVRFISHAPAPHGEENRKLGPKGISLGWRLACLHPDDPCELELPRPVAASRTAQTTADRTTPYALAVDLGTTSVHWQAVAHGETLASGGALNPQIGLGAEVMSRMAFGATPEGRAILRRLVVERLESIANDLNRSLGGPCTSLAVAGNPAMTYLLLGLSTDTLARAPYKLTYRGGDFQSVSPTLPTAYIPPLAAPFVGADLTAGLVALESGGAEYPFVLADLGTNGEFILALSPDERLCASVPMGPALEGVGLTFGRTASPGAVAGFEFSPAGLVPLRLEGPGGQGPGMTGTGYLSLTALLRRHGVLDETGAFGPGSTPLAAKLAAGLDTHNNEPVFRIEPGLYLAASDVEEILKVKAAFNLALTALLDRAGLGPSGLKAIHLAGALGEHVSLDDLEVLGFLPPGAKARTHRAGNTSLAGAVLLATDEKARDFAASLPPTIRLVDLTGSDDFGQRFVERMRFTHVH